MSPVAITAVAATLIALVGAFFKLRTCDHQFGLPVNGYVCCMKCARRYAIESTAAGEWRIGRRPVRTDEEVAAAGLVRR